MPTQIFKGHDGRSVFVIHEPGNMTRYVGTAHKIEDGPVGYKGNWAVSFPEFGTSMIFEEGQHAHWGYVKEKCGMGRTGYKLGDTDISEMAKVVAMMVPHASLTAITDDTGHLTAERASPADA